MRASEGASGVFGAIDAETDAYLLGWVASAGRVGGDRVEIDFGKSEVGLARRAERAIAKGLAPGVQGRRGGTVRLRSNAIARDVARCLDVELRPKATPVERDAHFPSHLRGVLGWAFLRGCFDARGRGVLRAPSDREREPLCRLLVRSDRLRSGIVTFSSLSSLRPRDRGCQLEWRGNNALDILGKLYEGGSLGLKRNRRLYLAWAGFVPSLSRRGANGPLFRWMRTCGEAVAPFKGRSSDSGYDLTLIRKAQEIGPVTLYGTGLKVEPEYGWYFDLVPRSSIIKTGHVLANSVGVIDRSYRGEILVPLLKIDPNAPELPLPCRVVQLIPRPIVHGQIEVTDELAETARGGSGFGSTG